MDLAGWHFRWSSRPVELRAWGAAGLPLNHQGHPTNFPTSAKYSNNIFSKYFAQIFEKDIELKPPKPSGQLSHLSKIFWQYFENKSSQICCNAIIFQLFTAFNDYLGLCGCVALRYEVMYAETVQNFPFRSLDDIWKTFSCKTDGPIFTPASYLTIFWEHILIV